MSSIRPERSNPLHNFSLPPYLKWGNQKVLRCMKISSSSCPPSPTSSSRSGHHPSSKLLRHRTQTTTVLVATTTPTKPFSNGSFPAETPKRNEENSPNGIGSSPEKLMSDLHLAANETKDTIFEDERELDVFASRPWNLRMRRSACKAPPLVESTAGIQEKCDSLSPVRQDKGESPNGKVTPSRLSRNSPSMHSGEKRGRPKFSIPLTKEDVELDFLMIVGNRPRRRPKKRPRMLQKQLDLLCPGAWLTEITADRYKLPDPIQSGKS